MIYQINNMNVPSNSKTQVTISDLDNTNGTGRTESGYAYRDRIRSGVRQLDIQYEMLTDEQVKTILDATSPEFFPVKYKDPWSGIITKTFYIGDRTSPLEYYVDGVFYWSLSFNLIEQ